METESALTVYSIVPSLFALQTPVRAIEPNPNWSTVGLDIRDYKNDWPLGLTVTTAAGPTTTNRGPTPRIYSSLTSKFPL